MSKISLSKKISTRDLRQRKSSTDLTDAKKIIVLTAYDYTTAKILDQSGAVDCLLVGDSLGMVMLGYPTTTSVTMADMLHHVKAVRRGTENALVIADMPFGSVISNEATAIENMTRMIQEGGADAVKIEGASPLTCRIIEQASTHGIPVMGHLGFTPQSVQTLGGFHLQAKTLEAVTQLISDAIALEKAGCFAVVLEMIPWQVAALVSKIITIPTIGIGAGAHCDGQVLVIDDFMGKFPDFQPRFARQYLHLANDLQQAVTQFNEDVQNGQFPSLQEAFNFPQGLQKALEELGESYGVVTSQNPAVLA